MCCLLILFVQIHPFVLVTVPTARAEPLHPVTWRA